MAEISKIAWTDATFNPWVGCTKVSPGCDNCYAEGWAKRSGRVTWGGERRRTSADYWRQPMKWNRDAAASGVRKRVFCASLADVFDNQADFVWRRDLYHLIEDTPALDWLLLTKRPQNIHKMLPEVYGILNPWPWPNLWLGITAENQPEFRRRWAFMSFIKATIRFISYEPAIDELDLAETFGLYHPEGGGFALKVGSRWEASPDWVICGGESGSHARPMAQRWARTVRDQCQAADVPFFMKQTGSARLLWPGVTNKGDDPSEWPADLRVREFPPGA